MDEIFISGVLFDFPRASTRELTAITRSWKQALCIIDDLLPTQSKHFTLKDGVYIHTANEIPRSCRNSSILSMALRQILKTEIYGSRLPALTADAKNTLLFLASAIIWARCQELDTEVITKGQVFLAVTVSPGQHNITLSAIESIATQWRLTKDVSVDQ